MSAILAVIMVFLTMPFTAFGESEDECHHIWDEGVVIIEPTCTLLTSVSINYYITSNIYGITES